MLKPDFICYDDYHGIPDLWWVTTHFYVRYRPRVWRVVNDDDKISSLTGKQPSQISHQWWVDKLFVTESTLTGQNSRTIPDEKLGITIFECQMPKKAKKIIWI